MSRAHVDGQFRLAFTLLLLDQYEALADAAWEQAPTLVPHAVVVEALRMVDEASVYVDPDTGVEDAVPATADWLSEWTLKALAAITSDEVRRERLPDKDPDWRAEHEDRLSLIAHLRALDERRLPVVLTLLGWPDAEAVETMAAAEQPTRLTVDRYRSLTDDGMRKLVEELDPAWAGSEEGLLAGLRWRVQSVMAPLVWHPESPHLVVDEADFADILGLEAGEGDPPPFEVGEDLPVGDHGGDDVAPSAPVDAVVMGPEAADESDPPPAAEEPAALEQVGASGAWWGDDVVPLDGVEPEPAEALVAVATSGRRPVIHKGVRRRVLAAGAVASVLTAVVGIVALSGPGNRPARAPGGATASTAVAKTHDGPRTKPRPPVRATPKVTGQGTAARSGSSTPKVKVVPKASARQSATRALSNRPASRSTFIVPRRAAATVPARPVWRAPVVTARDIQAEFLP